MDKPPLSDYFSNNNTKKYGSNCDPQISYSRDINLIIEAAGCSQESSKNY